MTHEPSPPDAGERPRPGITSPWSAKRRRFVRRVALTVAACLVFVWLIPAAVVWLETSFRGDPPTFAELSPAVGDVAPDFVLKDVDGVPYRLGDHVGRGPVVIEFGSFT